MGIHCNLPYVILILTVGICNYAAAFDETNAGCFFDINMADPTFVYTSGPRIDASPYTCYLECIKMDVILDGRKLTIGLTEGEICLCGYEDKIIEMESVTNISPPMCDKTCPGDGSKICGGSRGAISVYPNFPADYMKGLNFTATTATGILNVDGSDPGHNLLTGEEVYLNVTFGSFYCHASKPSCASEAGDLPAVNITVDYGDGSGTAVWNRENPQDLWLYSYSVAGTYTVMIIVTNVYNNFIQRIAKSITVTETVAASDQVEIICPDVIHPGEYFTCVADMPTGSDLNATLKMVDDLNGDTDSTVEMPVPNMFMRYPGGALKYASYNTTAMVSDPTKGYVLLDTYFSNVANISAIEFVPVVKGSIAIEIVKPICPDTRVWCSITRTCENKCISKLESLQKIVASYTGHSCGVATDTQFCSNEETCRADLTCPTSITKGSPIYKPVAYEVVFTLFSGSVTQLNKNVRKISKAVNTESLADITKPYAGYKLNTELAYFGDYFLAFRCPTTTASLCARLPFELSQPGAKNSTASGTVTGISYATPNDANYSPMMFPIRARLQEDRIIKVEKKFFCDRTTEKTVTLTLYDPLRNNRSVSTRKVSCQYPILEIEDLSPYHPFNTNNNSWHIVQPYPSVADLTANPYLSKIYTAQAWAREGETLKFHVRFAEGSHVQVSWKITFPNGVINNCISAASTAPANLSSSVTFETAAGKSCIFPFRYFGILYYGCTKLGDTPVVMCATQIDSDYNAKVMATCSSNCHVQYPRPEEVYGNVTIVKETVADKEGTETQYQKEYIKAFATEIELTRTFTTPGSSYHIEMFAQNMHNLDDYASFTWLIECGNPIIPGDWTLIYPRFMASAMYFNMSLKARPGAKLPTKPLLRIIRIEGDQRIDNDIYANNNSLVQFALQDTSGKLPSDFPKCLTDCLNFKVFDKMGVNYLPEKIETAASDGTMGSYGKALTISVPIPDMDVKKPISFGFQVQFYNGISSIKFVYPTLEPFNEDIQLLDPAPDGTGEWVTISALKWDYNWVEMFVPFADPIEYTLGYTLPEEFGSDVFIMDYVLARKKWYLPAGVPFFNVSLYQGTPRRVQYTFNNTDPAGFQPPPCFIDWPSGALAGASKFSIKHCPNITEGLYEVVLSAWNPVNGWFSTKPTLVEVLERIGPIIIDDFLILSDMNETKPFNLKLTKAGTKSCIVVDFGDDQTDNPTYEFYGNLDSCRIRFPDLSANAILPLNLTTKAIDTSHVYEKRGLYRMHVFGFDERNYAEAMQDLTIFRLPCNAPLVWIPKNQTSFLFWDKIPTMWKSKGFQTAAKASVECNGTVPTYMKWRVYEVSLVKDEESQIGMKEILTEIQINNTVPSWNQAVLDMPPLTLKYGLHKLVFRFDIETYEPSIPFFKEAFTYINITKSPLLPVLMDGSPSKVSRGWGQTITMFPERFSVDPDNPTDKVFNFTWYCRVVAPDLEEWKQVDDAGFPVFIEADARGIPKPSDAILINPPAGCFGNGPQPLKTSVGILGINTASFITYSRIYEILLVLSKDTRRAMVKLEIDLGAVPAPIAEIKCINSDLCFPKFGGVFVNPTSRLALKGNCLAECIGDETYLWDIYRETPPTVLNTTYCGSNTIQAATTVSSLTTTTGTTTTTTRTAPDQVAMYETVVVVDNTVHHASTQDMIDSTLPIKTTTIDTSILQRKKRAPIGGVLPDSCKYVFADGSRDARDSKELSIQQMFFELQDKGIKDFIIKLNITKKVWDGRKFTYSHGQAMINIFINDPPVNGTCTIKLPGLDALGKPILLPAKTGRALLDEFTIQCTDWRDPNDHAIVKFVFKVIEKTPRGNQTTMLYSGPLPEAKVVFPVGQFHLFVEINDEAGAYASYDIDYKFPTYLPDEADYKSVDIQALLQQYTDVGDQARVSQILLADASIRAKACWYNVSCALAAQASEAIGDFDYENMDDAQREEFNTLIRSITNANTDALNSAKDNLQFSTADQLEQGASTLYSITSNLVGSGPMSKTLDMQGRDAAVQLIQKMSIGFKQIEVPDPNKLKAFIEGTTGAAMAIMEGLNSILYSNDPNEIPLTDFEAAADMPYDTDIGDGSDADIPEDPNEALRKNAMKLTRIRAVEQVKILTSLVDDIAETTIKNSVVGEELKTKSPLGVQMTMSKLSGQSTVGKDVDGDGLPDIPLRYEFDDSKSVVQFPLGFCPSAPGFVQNITADGPCVGQWGFVFKEWETITATYPASANRLNIVTKQMDVDIYYDLGGKLDVTGMKVDIQIVLERMQSKNPSKVELPKEQVTKVDVEARKEMLKIRKKLPLIYHQMNTTRAYATINFQIKVEEPDNTRIVVMVRHEKMPILKECDFVKIVANIDIVDDGFLDWYIPVELVKNRTGSWYFGVVSIQLTAGQKMSDVITDLAPCSSSGIGSATLDWDFNTTFYEVRMYTGGMYYFNIITETWEGVGISVINTTNLVTAANTNHLTSFGTGFFPEPNKIDFAFIFVTASFTDNMTIFLLLIISMLFYLILMIWATVKDMKDAKCIPLPVMRDNHPDDKYLYEILVETGPQDSHATTSKINFILSGSDCDTDIRCFDDDERELFKKGARDGFLLSTPHPLGTLEYLRVWTDSSGLGEMSAWYLLSILVHNIQTGEVTRFLADQWLAIDRGTFEDDITIPASDINEELDTEYLMRVSRARKLSDDHLWWSIFTRPIRSRFNRKERVSAAFAFLYLSFLTNAMWYGISSERLTDPMFSLAILPMDYVDILIGLMSNLIVFPPTILIVLLFKKSKVFKRRANRVDRGIDIAIEKNRFRPPSDGGVTRQETEFDVHRDRGWPSFCKAVGWILCLVCIFGGAFMVVSYGLSFGNDKTYQWVTSMIVSFFSSLIITQPLKIVLIAMVIGYCVKKANLEDDHVFQDEELPKVYYSPDDPTIAARPKIVKPEKREMDPVFYQSLTKRKNQEQEMKTVLREMATYFVYVGIIMIIAYGNRDENAFLEKSALETAIVFGGTTCEIVPNDDPRYVECTNETLPFPYVNFMKVKDVNDWWNWLEKVVLPNVRVQNWYNDKPPYGLRGYLDDRVNRIIGYAIIRQTREKVGSCKPAKAVRGAIEECTGENGLVNEDTLDWCLGWLPKTHPNCTEYKEYEYVDPSEINSIDISAGIRDYGGGGYILELRGFIDDLVAKIKVLQENKWANNRTRSLSLEFSVYNAQVNIYGLVTCVAEFIGGGVQPWYRIEAIKLSRDAGIRGTIVLAAEILFVLSTFYYIVNLLAVLKKDGYREFCNNSWNLADCFTVALSILALGLYVVKIFVVANMTARVSETGGNAYIRLTIPALVNQYYEYVLSFTVFTSTIKFSRFISFHKAFMQISATIRLCFIGLSTFFVEFSIVFCAFSAFFFFVLKNDLDNFRDFPRTLENTLAMSIGKFNFGALRAADEMAAWIFFVFSIVVNMILINMMMAIINLAFEEIKANASDYQNKFELVDYVKRTAKEMIGVHVAEPIVPVYADDNADQSDEEEENATEKISQEFTQKTDLLLGYIERTYLAEGFVDTEEGRRVLAKMQSHHAPSGHGDEKKVMEYGFDAIFSGDKK